MKLTTTFAITVDGSCQVHMILTVQEIMANKWCPHTDDTQTRVCQAQSIVKSRERGDFSIKDKHYQFIERVYYSWFPDTTPGSIIVERRVKNFVHWNINSTQTVKMDANVPQSRELMLLKLTVNKNNAKRKEETNRNQETSTDIPIQGSGVFEVATHSKDSQTVSRKERSYIEILIIVLMKEKYYVEKKETENQNNSQILQYN